MKTTIKRVHMDMHKIRAGAPDAVTVQNRGRSHKAARVEIAGPSAVIYRPEKPLSCGAKAWVETRAAVMLFDTEGHCLSVIR